MNLGVYEFGEELLRTNDLDPVYVVLWNANLEPNTLKRWLLAYWCFYHVGTASWIADHKLEPFYWEGMERAAASKEWPRGSERRHFRGQASVKSVAWLKEKRMWPLFNWFQVHRVTTLPEVMGYVQSWYLFGDWIAFKVADMMERLDLVEVSFPPESMFSMFDAPKKGAELMAELHGPATGTNVYSWAYEQLTHNLEGVMAPPRYEREVNVQEIETILCKWKSHRNGHYPVGKDTMEIKHGLELFANSNVARQLLEGGRIGGLW